MRSALFAAIVLLLCVATPALAHRLDEYLQATTVDVTRGRVALEVRLTPGVEVFRTVFAGIDTDGDGVISRSEQRAYARRVLGDLSLTIDDKPAPLRLISWRFPSIDQIKDGLGDIVLECDVQVPLGGPTRRLVFENHHQSAIAAYLVNCLSPTDPDVRITAQARNYDQSFYRLDYVQAPARATPLPSAAWSTSRVWLGVNAAVLAIWIATLLRQRRARGFR
jgi:hypothetical protein